MAAFTADFLYRIAIGLRYEPRLIPWVKKSSKIACTKGREHSTSILVRYIPKKSSKGEESVASSESMKHIEVPKRQTRFEGLEKHKRFEQDVKVAEVYTRGDGPFGNFVLDDQEPVSSINLCAELGEKEATDEMWADDECMEERKEINQEIECNVEEFSTGGHQIPARGNRQDAEKLAIQLLATRAYTAVGLRKKLLAKNFPLDSVDAVIADFQSRGYINDCLYAETFSRSRWSSSCWGPKRIKQGLFEKGVGKEDAEKAIRLIFDDGENAEDHESVFGMSKASMDHLLLQASKPWLRSHGVSREKRKSRLVQWLQYRGFNWSVTNFVLKKLESDYPQ